jgi:peptidyl-prolyl cis-trans isomerase D
MSIIQRIRDKAAWLIFGAIALAMIGFIVTDAFQGRGGGIFGSRSTTLGKVNGKTIDYIDYSTRLKAQEAQYPGAMNDMMRQNLQDNLWSQMVEEALMKDQYEKLGIYVSDKEVGDILYGANPPDQLRQQFVNKETGQYDPNMAFQTIQEFKKRSPKEYNTFVESIITMRQREKYLSLLTNTYYVPKWMVERSNSENSQLANISFVNIPYSTISDSAVKVTDGDIEDYINARKEEFQQEESRGIAYVAFNAAPSPADSAAVRDQLMNVRAEFDSTTDYQSFLARNGSETPFHDAYITKSSLQVPNADTIRQLADGRIFGPYQDGGTYVLAKMIGKRNMPDSVRVRHILISSQNGAVPDSVSKRRIDSAVNAINGGADFKTLAALVSEDPGSKDKGGEYWFSAVQFADLAKAFAEVAFYGNVGDKKTVKSEFGWHYMEVLEQKNIQPAYKVAYLSKSVLPSTETENRASGMANQFAGQSRNQKAFDDNVAKSNGTMQKILVGDIKPTQMDVPGLGANRQLVRWIYEADLGDVSEPYVVGDQYVVAVVTEVNKEGLMTAKKARPLVENLVRNRKKAEQIKQKLGKPATLDAAATAGAQTVQNIDSVSFTSYSIPNVGQEMKLIGAIFNKAWQNKVSEPIAGNGGVFVFQTKNIFARPNASADVEQQRTAMMMQQRQSMSYRAIESIKKAATIKDYRAKFL